MDMKRNRAFSNRDSLSLKKTRSRVVGHPNRNSGKGSQARSAKYSIYNHVEKAPFCQIKQP